MLLGYPDHSRDSFELQRGYCQEKYRHVIIDNVQFSFPRDASSMLSSRQQSVLRVVW